jgi:predicted rRNA methylase YqxC with S4 and FtsJ domains
MCIESLLKMLEELLEFLLRNAYIIVALKGTPMFESGKKAIGLLKENLIDVYALNKIGDFVMVLARLFVAAFAGILCYNLIPVS